MRVTPIQAKRGSKPPANRFGHRIQAETRANFIFMSADPQGFHELSTAFPQAGFVAFA
jgi:hypothetical protein